RNIYSKKILSSDALQSLVAEMMHNHSLQTIAKNPEQILDERIPRFLLRANSSPLSAGNNVKVLKNGQEKFDAVFNAIAKATSTIQIEYYIMERGELMDKLEELLIKKAQEGVKVRIIYDDFGSSSIRKRTPERLAQHGIEIHPFYKIKLLFLASRL